MILDSLQEKLLSDKVSTRILSLSLLWALLYFPLILLSYFFLPEGFLLGKNQLTDFETSQSLLLCALQIFGYNLLSVGAILLCSLFARKKPGKTSCRSLGTTAFLLLAGLNAVTLGTWSFTARPEPVPLLGQLLGSFDLLHRAGLWEMAGQLLIAAAAAPRYLVLLEGKGVTTRKRRDNPWRKEELWALVGGLGLLFLGALVESRALTQPH